MAGSFVIFRSNAIPIPSEKKKLLRHSWALDSPASTFFISGPRTRFIQLLPPETRGRGTVRKPQGYGGTNRPV